MGKKGVHLHIKIEKYTKQREHATCCCCEPLHESRRR